MNVESIQVENVKCDGCATTIKKALADVPGVTNVSVDVNNSKVLVVYEYGDMRPTFLKLLRGLGYPEFVSNKSLIESF